jgi:hypothetical protein
MQTEGDTTGAIARAAVLVVAVVLSAWRPSAALQRGGSALLLPVEIPTTVAIAAPDRALALGTDPGDLTVLPPWHRGGPVGDGLALLRHSCAGATPLRGSGQHPDQHVRAGRLERFDWGPPPPGQEVSSPTWDLLDEIRSLRVSVVSASGVARPCERWVFGRWVCGPDAWNYVGATTVAVRDREERCLWAHPTAEGVLRIETGRLPPGATLRGRGGLSDGAAANEDAAPVRLRVFVVRPDDQSPGAPALEREFPSRRGWSNWRVELPDAEGVRVRVEVDAADVGQRHFCLTASARAGVGRATPPATEPRGSSGGARSTGEGSAAAAGEGSGERVGTAGIRPSRRARVQSARPDAAAPGSGEEAAR